MKVVVLSSSSSGNSTYVEYDNVKFLIDAGLGFNDMKNKLNEIVVNASDIDFIIVTHANSDHVKSLHSFNQEKDNKILIYEKQRNDDDQAYRNAVKDILDDCIAHFSEDEKEKYKQEIFNLSCLYLTRYSLWKYHNDIFDMLDKLNKKPEEDED